MVTDRSHVLGRSDHTGRRKGFLLSAAQLMDQYVAYSKQHRDPAKQEFCRFIETTRRIDDLPQRVKGISKPALETWLREYGLDWPIVPTHDQQARPVLVFLVSDEWPYPVLWASPNCQELLGLENSAICGYPIRRLRRVEDDKNVRTAMHAVRTNPPPFGAPIDRLWLATADGLYIPVSITLTRGRDGFCVYASVLGKAERLEPPDEPEHAQSVLAATEQEYELSNVEPFIIRPPALTVKRSLHGLSAGRAHGTLTHITVTPADGELKRYLSEMTQTYLDAQDNAS